MSKILILGGGNCKLSAVKLAKRLGHTVVLADYYECPPAAAYADLHRRVSTFDIPGCIALARREQVDGVMTIGTDQPVYTAAAVAKACSLPSPIDAETALAVTNKRVMKQILTDHHIPTVRWKLFDEDIGERELSELCPPLVIKPLDSQGQRGVYKMDSPAEILCALPQTLSFSRERQALVEEYYPSDEVTLSGWIQNGRLYILALTDRQCHPDPVHIGVCAAHRFPSVHMDRYPEIREMSEHIVHAFQIPEGPLYIQFLIGAQGVLVNELACRIGGAFEDVFIPYLSGFDILHAALCRALGLPVDCSVLEGYDPQSCSRQVSVHLLFCRSGQIASITPLSELLMLPFVLSAGYNYQEGEAIPPLENATARFGHCVLASEDGRMPEHIAELYRTLQVLDPHGQNLVLKRDIF